MQVSEKSLELNIGAELLDLFRADWGMPKTYLRGLTQREERQEGVDFFAQLDPQTRLFAFQFKAPQADQEGEPYRYKLVKRQHERLFELAKDAPGSVFYVFPFYVTTGKLQQDLPHLAQGTWLLDVHDAPTDELFAGYQTRTISCVAHHATVNPRYGLKRLRRMPKQKEAGIAVTRFARWYRGQRAGGSDSIARLSPSVSRGLRVAIVSSSPPV